MSDACFGSDVTRERIEMFYHSLGFAYAVSTQQAARPWLTCRCQSCRKDKKPNDKATHLQAIYSPHEASNERSIVHRGMYRRMDREWIRGTGRVIALA